MNAPQQFQKRPGEPSELHEALWSPKREYRQALRQSFVIGLLMLAPSWYMFEVYGRVLNSRNTTTLMWLLLAALGIYVVLELMELARSRVLARAAEKVNHRLKNRVFNASFTAGLRNVPGGNPQSVSDLKSVADFIPSQAVTGALDLPAALIVLVLLFMMNIWIGVLAVVAAGLQAALGVVQQKKGAKPYGEANSAAAEGQLRAAGTLRNAQVIEAMGMQGDMYSRWMTSQRRFIARLSHASDNASTITNLTKLLTNLQGSLLLGLAAWVGLIGDLNGGLSMVIVASILGGRALAPLAQMVAQWRQIGAVQSAYKRVDFLLKQVPAEARAMPLPAPNGVLTVEGLQLAPPGVPMPILKGVNFFAKPGEMLTIIGPSAAGKSTLARAIIGVWPAQVGKVRLDGADVYDWPKAELGPHVGYLSQGVELFDGSIAENIARFGKVDMEQVRKAAQMVGVMPVIDALPDGFDTDIGDDGAVLSGGQRQRIGLARAIYGTPRLVVLDEPNSSLDEKGEADLLTLLQMLKALGTTVIAITHRRSLLAAADNVLLLNDGMVSKFGPRDDVLNAIKESNEKAMAQMQEQARARAAAQAGQPAALSAPNPAQGAAA